MGRGGKILSFCEFLLITLSNIISGLFLITTGFLAYRFYHFNKNKVEKIKESILGYLELATVEDTSEEEITYNREVLHEDGIIEESDSLVYPSTRAIYQRLLSDEEIYKVLKYGIKIDEDYIARILNELIMEGRVGAVRSKINDEIIGWKFSHWEI